VARLDKHVHSKQRKATTTKLCSVTSSLFPCPASSASIGLQSVVGFTFLKEQVLSLQDSLTTGSLPLENL